jgi:acetolactate decarboxylase
MNPILRQGRLAAWSLVLLLCLGLTACAHGQKRDEGEVLYQVSTLEALLEGAYDGQASVGQLAQMGDFGLGTLEGLDGELVVLDGNFFQVRTDGLAYPVPPERLSPFANLVRFRPDKSLSLNGPLDMAALTKALDQSLPSLNLFYAVRLEGQFDLVVARSVPVQKKPYPGLAQAVAQQSVFKLEKVRGTLVGLRCPDLAKGINMPGYHFHFLDSERRRGGHVLSLAMVRGEAQVATVGSLHLMLPRRGGFLRSELGRERGGVLKELEEGR